MTSVPGRTVVTARALEKVVAGLVRDAARVSTGGVRLSDAAGQLAVAVQVPVALGDGSSRTLAERGVDVREHVVRGMAELAGRRVGEVEVTFTGVVRSPERRVR